jgi:hypothetical protein
VDEHLPQRTLPVADIEQCHSPDDLALRKRDPEIARALLVEGGNVLKIGLILQRDRDFKLVPLNANDERTDFLEVRRGKRDDSNHARVL